MRKIVDFGISEASKIGRLSSSHDRPDHINGIGEYLGIFRLGNKNLLFTKTTRSGGGQHDGEIMINEVDFDMYFDGGIVVYFNTYKPEGVRELQRSFNSPAIVEMINSGKTIQEILEKLRVDYRISPIAKLIESDFMPSHEYIYPKDFDFKKAMMPGSDYDREDEVKKEPVERLLVAGLEREVFEDLLETKKNIHQSFYDVASSQREKGINR